MSGEGMVTAERSPSRCPYCKDALDRGTDLVASAPCGARHHGGCFAEHGRCATCGATDVLERRTRSRREQPAGSAIRVTRRDDGGAAYEWDVRCRADLFLGVLFCLSVILLPLGLWLLTLRRRHPTLAVVVTPEGIDFHAVVNGLTVRRVTARRDEVGDIGVNAFGSGFGLTIDVGVARHLLMTGISRPVLGPPELEWLAAELRDSTAGRSVTGQGSPDSPAGARGSVKPRPR